MTRIVFATLITTAGKVHMTGPTLKAVEPSENKLLRCRLCTLAAPFNVTSG